MTNIQRIVLATVGFFLLAPLMSAASTTAETTTLATLSYLGRNDLPLGMRNNNPGNIRVSNNAWQGKIVTGNGRGFEQFKAYVWGIRAMIRQLFTYQDRGWDTIDKILYKWAPPADNNDTEAYVRFVSTRTGIGRDTTLNLRDRNVMSAIVRAMAQMENYGGNNEKTAVTNDQFDYAWTLANT